MSKKIIIIALTLLVTSINSASATERMPRIIGGGPADSSAWPWMAGLTYKVPNYDNEVFCGASLIASDWVLTSAHCIIDENSKNIEVIINQAKLDGDGGERLEVEYILLHPEYDDFSLENDLALIKLATPSSNQPINVLAPYSSQDNEGKAAIALGWGTTSTTSLKYPLDLQQVDLPLIGNPQCDTAMGDITDDMLCAGDGLGGKDTCFGDSGGPLIVFDTESQSWRQVGITSWGFDCAAPDVFGVYTRLKNYASFISEHICTPSQTPAPVSLDLGLDGNTVNANWNSINDISGYRLNYAPYPTAQTIYSMDMNQITGLSVELPTGSAFYVAITSYHGNCLSDYSNIEHFVIK